MNYLCVSCGRTCARQRVNYLAAHNTRRAEGHNGHRRRAVVEAADKHDAHIHFQFISAYNRESFKVVPRDFVAKRQTMTSYDGRWRQSLRCGRTKYAADRRTTHNEPCINTFEQYIFNLLLNFPSWKLNINVF